MSDLQAYLAAKYMTGAKADAILDRADELGKRRKKKRKTTDYAFEDGGIASGSGNGSMSGKRREGSGGMIVEDDDGGWGRAEVVEDDEARPVVEERRGHFKPKSSNSWATVRESDPSLARTPTPEPEDETPYIVSTTVSTVPTPAPSKPRGGLQSAADLKAENARRAEEVRIKKVQSDKEHEERKRAFAEAGGEEGDEGNPNETVYRDSSGRRIDTKREKAEEAKRKREEQEREMKKMEWGKGLVQKVDKQKKKLEEEAMAFRPIARYADDEDMNNEMKDVERWNDPAAAFLTKKKSSSSGPKLPRYNGPPPPPNRFGIPPGYRWDGVDRANGFEKTLLQRGNQNKMRAAEAHAWQTDDM